MKLSELTELLVSKLAQIKELRFHTVAGDLLNAFYSALILKKLSGVGITPDLENDTLFEIVSKYVMFCDQVAQAEHILKEHGETLRESQGC